MIGRILGVAGVAAALAMATACGGGSSSTASNPGSSSASAPAQTIQFTETEFKIEPANATLKAGSYEFKAVNSGQFPHDLRIATSDGSEVGHSTVIQGGQSSTFQVTLKPGTYTIWCAVDGHRARGMQGTVTVS